MPCAMQDEPEYAIADVCVMHYELQYGRDVMWDGRDVMWDGRDVMWDGRNVMWADLSISASVRR